MTFVGSTILIWILTAWGIVRAHSLARANECLSDAALYAALTPIALWAYSLYVRCALSKLVGGARETKVGSPLAWLHLTFPVLIALLMMIIVQAIVNCHAGCARL